MNSWIMPSERLPRHFHAGLAQAHAIGIPFIAQRAASLAWSSGLADFSLPILVVSQKSHGCCVVIHPVHHKGPAKQSLG